MNAHKALLMLVIAFLLLSVIVLTFVFLPGSEPAPSRVTPDIADSGAPDEEAVEPPPVEDAPDEPVEETPAATAETPSDESGEADIAAEGAGDLAEDDGEDPAEEETPPDIEIPPDKAFVSGTISNDDAPWGVGHTFVSCYVKGNAEKHSETRTTYDGEYKLDAPPGIEIYLTAMNKEFQQFESEPFTVDGGSEKRLDINLGSYQTCTIKGVVIDDATDKPIPAISISYGITGSGSTCGTSTDALGAFSWKVESGNYTVYAEDHDFWDYEGYSSEPFTLSADETKELEIRLKRGSSPVDLPNQATVKGVVKDKKSGRPARYIIVRCINATTGVITCTRLMANDKGEYSIEAPAGILLRLEFSTWGEKVFETEQFILAVGEEKTIDVALGENDSGDECQEAENSTVKGVVVNAVTGEAIGGADIWLWQEGSGSGTILGADGEFEFSSTPGNHTLEVTYPGYVKYSYPIVLFENRVHEIEVRLFPSEAYIEGIIVDALTGRPLEGVFLTDFLKEYAVTGKDGKFRFLAVPGKRYDFDCELEGYYIDDYLPRLAPAPESEDDFWISDDENEVHVKVETGATITLRIEMAKYAQITVKVCDASTHKPLDGARIVVWRIKGPGSASGSGGRTNAEGVYEHSVKAGRFEVEVEMAEYGAQVQEFELAPSAEKEIVAYLTPLACEIYGRVTNAVGGEPIVPADDEYEHDGNIFPTPGHISVIVVVVDDVGDPIPIHCAVNEDGYFSRRIDPGSCEIACVVKGYFLFRKDISLREGQCLEINIAMTPLPEATATIKGTVVWKATGEPDGEVRITVCLGEIETASVETDEDGSFSVKVPPGELTIKANRWPMFVFEDGNDENNDFWGQAELEVTIADYETLEVVLELEQSTDDEE